MQEISTLMNTITTLVNAMPNTDDTLDPDGISRFSRPGQQPDEFDNKLSLYKLLKQYDDEDKIFDKLQIDSGLLRDFKNKTKRDEYNNFEKSIMNLIENASKSEAIRLNDEFPEIWMSRFEHYNKIIDLHVMLAKMWIKNLDDRQTNIITYAINNVPEAMGLINQQVVECFTGQREYHEFLSQGTYDTRGPMIHHKPNILKGFDKFELPFGGTNFNEFALDNISHDNTKTKYDNNMFADAMNTIKDELSFNDIIFN